MTQQQEYELINRAQAGSVAAYEEIVRHYQDRLLRFLMVRGLQQVDAEDAAQSTFVAAWQNLSSYRSKWRFSTWLYTIARRTAIQHKPSANHHDILENSSSDLDPCLTEQLRNNVWSVARDQLEPRVFQALWLHYGEGFSGAEVARIMQRTTVWVRVTLHRARNDLHKIFANDNSVVTSL